MEKPNLLKGIAISGEFVAGLKKKTFKILKAPHYERRPDLDDPTKEVEKLIIFVETSEGSRMDYYPNKTSQKSMANMWGYDMNKWIGKKAEWITEKRRVMGTDKVVLFVVEKADNKNGKAK